MNPIRLQAWNHWIAIPRVGRNPESVREYLHAMLIPHEHTYKRDNINTTVEWRSPEAEWKAQRLNKGWTLGLVPAEVLVSITG